MSLLPVQALMGADEAPAWLLDALPDGIVAVDAQGLLREVNARAADMFGYAKEVLLGSALTSLLPNLNGLFGSERFWSDTGRRENDTEFPVDVTVSTRIVAGERMVILAIRDMSEQRRLEWEALKDGMRIRQVAQNLDTVFILQQFDPPEYLYVSPGSRTVLGLEPEALMALEDPLSVVYPDDRDRFRKEYSEPLVQRRVAMCEHRIITPAGRIRWVRSFSHPIVIARGEPEQAIITCEDITERKLASEALQKAEATARLANEAKSRFMSRMSHELRTPLNSVLGFGQILAMELEEPSQVAAVQQIVGSGRHLLELIDDMMDIASIEAGETSVRLGSVRVSDLVRDCSDMLIPMASTAGVTVMPGQGSTDVMVLADTQRLRQLLVNLLSNAIKYNQPQGHVWVTWQATDESAAIAVHDDGKGLDAEQQSRLFTAFDRLGADATTVPGTGLGLALSKSLAEAMHGSIGVESTLGEGSVFTIHLPAVPGAGDDTRA